MAKSIVGSSRPAPTKNIIVEVSGSRFCIVPSLYKNIENLHWKKQKSISRNKGTLKLSANPDVFESVLQFFLYSKLPDDKSLSIRRAKTLIDFVSPLDPASVKPLVDHLESFIAKNSTTAKTNMVRRSLTNLSLPFLSRIPRSKNKISDPSSIDQHTDQNSSSVSGNGHKTHKSSDNILSGLQNTAKNDLSSSVPSIPSHIEHPVTKSMAMAEMSVCSLDESSSVSKLSLQSSSTSLGMMFPPGPQYQSSIPAMAPTLVNNQHCHNQSQWQLHCKENVTEIKRSNAILNERDRYSGFYSSEYNALSQPYTAISTVESQNIYDEHDLQDRIPTKADVNDYCPSTDNDSFMVSAEVDSSKRNCYDFQNHSHRTHKLHSTTKIILAVLGGKKNCGSIGNDPVGKSIFSRKPLEMTHAEWCASEYVV